MSAEHQSISTAVEAVSKLVQLLHPLLPEERERAISAAFILMGQSPVMGLRPVDRSRTNMGEPDALETSAPLDSGLSPKVGPWLSKNALSIEQLEHVFSIDKDGIDVIAANLPGSSKRQNTFESYLLCGLKAFLQTGETAFNDKDARSICSKVGCYDTGNHFNYMKAFGNTISGSKETGWKLTNPGLVEAAKVIKTLAGS